MSWPNAKCKNHIVYLLCCFFSWKLYNKNNIWYFMVLVILVVILEQLCVLVHCEGESLYEGVKARGAVLYLLPENLGQFVWTVETVCVTGLPFHQRISARWEQHLKKKITYYRPGGRWPSQSWGCRSRRCIWTRRYRDKLLIIEPWLMQELTGNFFLFTIKSCPNTEPESCSEGRTTWALSRVNSQIQKIFRSRQCSKTFKSIFISA